MKDINERINEDNKKKFKRYGLQRTSRPRYKCCLCGKFVSIDGSFSNNGDRLICAHCGYENFKTMKDLFDWIGGNV